MSKRIKVKIARPDQWLVWSRMPKTGTRAAVLVGIVEAKSEPEAIKAGAKLPRGRHWDRTSFWATPKHPTAKALKRIRVQIQSAQKEPPPMAKEAKTESKKDAKAPKESKESSVKKWHGKWSMCDLLRYMGHKQFTVAQGAHVIRKLGFTPADSTIGDLIRRGQEGFAKLSTEELAELQKLAEKAPKEEPKAAKEKPAKRERVKAKEGGRVKVKEGKDGKEANENSGGRVKIKNA